MRSKLATLTALESLAGQARRLGLGSLADRMAPIVSRPFERFELDVDGVRLAGTDLAQLHYVRELWEHGRERTFVRLLAEAVPEGGTVLEGGAHLGYVTITLRERLDRPAGSTAFEPNVAVRDVLRRNSGARRRREPRLDGPKALGDPAGTAWFYLSEDTSSLFEPSSAECVAVEVDVVRADEEVDGPVDVVKLDLGGSEVAALKGMTRFLGARPPRAIFVECHPELLDKAGASREELLAMLEGHGYHVEWIDEDAGPHGADVPAVAGRTSTSSAGGRTSSAAPPGLSAPAGFVR